VDPCPGRILKGRGLDPMDVDGDEYLREMEENLKIDKNKKNGKEETASQEQQKTVLERA
jgi:hypothetical protein